MRLLLILVGLQAAIVLSSYSEDELEDTLGESRDSVDDEIGLTLENAEKLFMERERQVRECRAPCRLDRHLCRCPPAPRIPCPPPCRRMDQLCVCTS